MGLSASQGRLLLLTAKQSDLEFRAQQISQKRLVLAQQLEEISKEYEDATSNRVMNIAMYTTDIDEDGNAVKTSGNLTYKNLISGTLQQGLGASAGIKKYSKTGEIGASSNVAYRLTDPHGAIVVSSYDEILDEYVDVVKTTKKDTNPNRSVKNGVYTVSTTTRTSTDGIVNDDAKTNETKYFVAGKNSQGEETALSKAASDKNAEYDVDEEQGLVRITDADGNDKYYKISDGSEATLGEKGFNQTGKAKVARSIGDVPYSTTTTNDTTTTEYNEDNGMVTIKPGGDNKYTVYVNGVAKARYVVDSGLVTGSSNGNTSDPNYLQDCLRNGKYILQKYTPGDDHNEGTWNDIAWDATSNISDRYYTEDDAAAKAVYDRKQNEIQNADKKLELELDNVESQRNAVKTEIESVEKVINDNIDKSFKTFA